MDRRSDLRVDLQTGAVTEGDGHDAVVVAPSLEQLFERRLQALVGHLDWRPELGVWMGPDDLPRELEEEGDAEVLDALAGLASKRLGAFKVLVLPYIGRLTPFFGLPSRQRFGRTKALEPAFNGDLRLFWSQQDIEASRRSQERPFDRRVLDALADPPIWSPHEPDRALSSALGEPEEALTRRLLRWNAQARAAFAERRALELGSIGLLSARRQREIIGYAGPPAPNVIPAHWVPHLQYAPAFLSALRG
jgi:hypothetical protein